MQSEENSEIIFYKFVDKFDYNEVDFWFTKMEHNMSTKYPQYKDYQHENGVIVFDHIDTDIVDQMLIHGECGEFCLSDIEQYCKFHKISEGEFLMGQVK